MHTMLTHGVDWVGAIDWNIRDFHGYETSRGSTCNAYLVRGERTALIDTVKHTFSDVLLANIEERVGLDAIDYVVANHGEPDHSSALRRRAGACHGDSGGEDLLREHRHALRPPDREGAGGPGRSGG